MSKDVRSSLLELLKAVEVQDKVVNDWDPRANQKELLNHGVIIDPKAFTHNNALHGVEIVNSVKSVFGISERNLRKTFYKTFEEVEGMNRFELLIDQLIHYATTYGGFFAEGFKDGVYIPNDTVNYVDFVEAELTKVAVLTRREIAEKVAVLAYANIAYSEDQLKDLLVLVKEYLVDIDVDKVVNRELQVMLADIGLLPSNPDTFLRLIVYKLTGETLLIKNKLLLSKIKESMTGEINVSIVRHLLQHYEQENGLKPFAEGFNRNKPFWLALKTKKSQEDNRAVNRYVNKVSKLSKDEHKPMWQNPLNNIAEASDEKALMQAIENASTPMLVRVYNSLNERLHKDYLKDGVKSFKVRNGKLFIREYKEKELKNAQDFDQMLLLKNKYTLLAEIANRVEKNLKDKVYYIPEGVEYTVPTSAKDFVGSVPNGTSIDVDLDEDFIVGIHWEHGSGCWDLDLHATSKSTQIGYFSNYYDDEKTVVYLGDITQPDKEHGATEGLKFTPEITEDFSFVCSPYSSEEGSEYKLFLSKVSKDPDYATQTGIGVSIKDAVFIANMNTQLNRSQTLGSLYHEDGERKFYIHAGLANEGRNISHEFMAALLNADKVAMTTKLKLSDILDLLRVEVVRTPEDIADLEDYVDLSLSAVTVESFVDLIK